MATTKTSKPRSRTTSSSKARARKSSEKGKPSRRNNPTARASEVSAKNATAEERRFLNRYKDRLSRTTLRAKWIHSPEEHEDRPGQSLVTRSHDVIQHWAEERGGVPATVPDTQHEGRPGVLRFDFPGFGYKRLQPISWDEWFQTFDERKLIFLFQEHLKNGNQSNFFRFDSPLRENT